MRPELDWLESCPNCTAVTVMFGLPNCVWLVTFRRSSAVSRDSRSYSRKLRRTLASQLRTGSFRRLSTYCGKMRALEVLGRSHSLSWPPAERPSNPTKPEGGAVFPVQTAAGEYHMLMFCEWVWLWFSAAATWSTVP